VAHNNEYLQLALRSQFAAHLWDLIEAFESEHLNRREIREVLVYVSGVPDDQWEKIRDLLADR
jgi:hypothetical protein